MRMCKIKTCANYDKCNDEHCIYSYGYALANFLMNVDCVDTEIGNIRDATSAMSEPMIVSGIQIESDGMPSHILSPLTISLDLTNKFIGIHDKTATQVLSYYLDKFAPDTDISDSKSAAIRQRLKDIQYNHTIVAPIKPKTSCSVRAYNSNSNTYDIVNTTVEFIKWVNNIKTGKFEGSIITYVTGIDDEIKRYRLNLEDYGTAFTLSQLECGIRGNKLNRECIKMTKYGFIKPIEVSDGRFIIILDSTYMYIITDGKVRIAGYWDGADLVESDTGILDSIKESKAYKYIQDNLGYIERHIRFIAPYGVVESNRIEI